MSATDRQNRLLIAEDWTRIYQSFRNADFQSYDFENLRRVMINYLRENYPEDFNDYIESSEYLALIDLIAFLGQSISYRIDLNARDNFIELAERRESVLRLARLLSYNAKRNIAASGLLKFSSISTSQNIYDSNGRNLAGQTVTWNDSANTNWYDQFIKILNAALPATRQFGNPDDKAEIQGIMTEQYRFQAANADVPVYSFSKPVDGRGMDFEIVSTTFKDANEIYEEPPVAGNRLAFVYRNDNRGNGSANTGFFVHFRQGILNQGTFTIDQPSVNESVDIDAININNSDVWLYKLDQNGLESEQWAKVSALEGNNIIYNSLKKNIKNVYSVITRSNDRVSLVFSDGTFGNLPRGTFRTYYRVSNGISYTINPKDIRNVSISIPYVSNVGQIENLTLSLNLMTSVGNSSSAETTTNIKERAPATYYTQNRMITAEDYNISPLSVSQEVIKVKSINRSASGISRYFDLVDPTGKYSQVNLFSDDGALYEEEYLDSFRFKFVSKTDIEGVIYNELLEKMSKTPLRDYFYSKVPRKSVQGQGWFNKTTDTNMSTGYVGNPVNAVPSAVGETVEDNLNFLRPGALIKFSAPVSVDSNVTTYSYFDRSNNNKLVTGISSAEEIALIPNAATYIWSKAISVRGNGIGTVAPGEIADGLGPIKVNDIIPTGALITEIIPPWKTTLTTDVISVMIGLIFANKPFGLRYDVTTLQWKIITEVNLNMYGEFSTVNEGSTSGQQRDSSWLILFTTDTEYYSVKIRLNRYIFESDKQVRFYFDSADNVYDSRSAAVIKDTISVLSVNTTPNSITPLTYDRVWQIDSEYTGIDGYIDTKKVQVTFNDSDNDGIVDNPDIFNDLVSDSFVILEKYEVFQGQEDYRVFDNSKDTVLVCNTETDLSFNYTTKTYDLGGEKYSLGQYFYFKDTKLVKRFISTDPATLEISLNYKVYEGRDKLKFQYKHNANFDSRIDPGLTNLIDIFVLTKQYDRVYRQWLLGSIAEEPLPPSSDALFNLLAPELNQIKSISDEIIYHPVKYKMLFGNRASENLRAAFKVVKNPNSVVSDNDIKSKTLAAINEFFNLDNWDFGDSFYFTELSSYVMNRLAPNIVNFIIVPRDANLSFGNLLEIRAERDQIFVNGATIDDIEIISTITASNIKSTGDISLVFNEDITQQVTSTGINNVN
jgi:hypothetical protein